MPPRKTQKRPNTAEEALASVPAPAKTNKRTKKVPNNNDTAGSSSAPPEDPELVTQVMTILKAFFQCSLNWTGGDDDLEFKRSKLSLVKGKSYTDPDEDDEILVITRKDNQPFTQHFVDSLRPFLVETINEIVISHNKWLEATNYRIAYLTQEQLNQFFKVFLNPIVSDSCGSIEDEDLEVGERKGAIGFRRESGNSYGRWDYTEDCPEDLIEEYKGKPKGKGKKLNPVK